MSTALAPASAGLWLYIRSAGGVLALAADTIERALLVDEAPAPRWPPELGPALAPPGCLGLLAVRGVEYGAWDLGVLLGTEPARRSWILLKLSQADGPLALALRAEDCLHVGPLPGERRMELPPGVLRSRRPFRAAIPAPAARSAARSARVERALVALELDVAALWSDYELEFTRELQRHALAAEGPVDHA